MKEKEEINKIFSKFSAKYNLKELIGDIFTYLTGIICLYNGDSHLEKELEQITKKYSKKDIDIFDKLLELFDKVIQQNPTEDFLGDLLLKANILNGEMSTENIFPKTIKQYQQEEVFSKKDVTSYIKKTGFLSIFDETYSGGRKSIATADSITKLGIDKKDIFFLIHEKNPIYAYLTYLNVSLRDLSGVVKEIDPITKEEKQALFTPVFCRNRKLVSKIEKASYGPQKKDKGKYYE